MVFTWLSGLVSTFNHLQVVLDLKSVKGKPRRACEGKRVGPFVAGNQKEAVQTIW